ncbi:uncharacterized protein LOC116405618 [Cucumis sativus]|uniref:Uncharacterized protein n=1 Tax=Cucumis sativus TaxID=3659 RepID=A0ACB6HC82_CUCSA|nr:uncharacterized protein LOC101209037 [Cucumis sativus]XP_031745412.1 uncharacterized protein LOC116405618 [Cucumis sativus]KAE8637517.1 hypothetical protein CSA_004750 [Cucumis sativus]KAE8648126.1 hypothetical protein Csa_021517 [Cucumis sativus]
MAPVNRSPILLFVFLQLFLSQTLARKPHLIDFRSPNLYPEGLVWDTSAQHFVVGSLHQRTLVSVSDAGVAETLIRDPSLPENASILGLAIDSVNSRLLAAVHAPPLPEFNALASYDLRSRHRISLTPLPSDGTSGHRPVANAVAVDFKGNAFITNSGGNFIWKVDKDGSASIFSKSASYSSYPATPNEVYSSSGLNGAVYVSKGYLLVVQSNTGKMFKVDADDGTARLVLLNKELKGADGIAARKDGVVLVVSYRKLWFLKSEDSWGEGVVYDEIDLDEEKFATAVAVGNEGRVYVLNGYVNEGLNGNLGREMFGIEEMRSPKESEDERVWIYVLVGFGLAYFLFWRFQMKQLIGNMDKKTN